MKNKQRIEGFVEAIWEWYGTHKRQLPWRDMQIHDDTERAYRVLASWAPEWVFAVIMLIAGTLRLAGLVINGARRRVTPWMRLAGALIGCGLFTAISLGFAASGVVGTWIAAWPVVAVVEFFNIYDTTRDARQAHG